MKTFAEAKISLHEELSAYAYALCTIVSAMPEARLLCDKVLKEVKLAQALLAFASWPQTNDLKQCLFHLTNLWPYRERPFARTSGFGEEMQEARMLGDVAHRGAQMLAKQGNDPIASEITMCLKNIAEALQQEHALLQECHTRIQPFANGMDMTRKRLNLLVCAVDARMETGPDQERLLASYQKALQLLDDWDNGVSLDQEGIRVLEQCLQALEDADGSVAADFQAYQYAIPR